MPAAPLHPCPHPHCRLLVRAGYCSRHRALHETRPNVDVRRWYRTARWAALRREVLRADPFCAECLAEGFPFVTTQHADHRIPHRGDPALFWARDNLQGLCHRHHSRKTGRGE